MYRVKTTGDGRYMKEILKKSSNSQGGKVPAKHLSPQNETFTAMNGLHLIDLFVKWTPWKPPPLKTQTIGCGTQTDDKTLLLKKTSSISH